MRDLYKRLNVRADASEAVIRDHLPLAEEATRIAAEAILLDPRRRQVYDRNRDVLRTIGQLRLNLGLNYTRFWAQREYSDFWRDGRYVPPRAEPQRRLRNVDKMMIAQAFHTVRHHGRRHVALWGWGWLAAAAGGSAVAIFAIILWRIRG